MKRSYYIFLAWAIAWVLLFAGCKSVPHSGKKTDPGKKTEPKKVADKPVPKKTDTPGKKEEPKKKPGETPAKVDPRGLVNKKPDAKGRPVRTYFYGAVLIREKALVNGIPVTRITIGGGAVLRHNDVELRAPRIILEGGRRGRIEGGVVIRDVKNGLTLRAARADYDRDKQLVELMGNPYMVVRKDKTKKPVIVTATRVKRNLAENVSILEGDVRILHENWTLLADRGDYFDQDDRIDLKKNPMILGSNQFFTGDGMVYHVEKREIELNGRVSYMSRNANNLSFAGTTTKTTGPVSLYEFARTGGRAAGTETTTKTTTETTTKKAPKTIPVAKTGSAKKTDGKTKADGKTKDEKKKKPEDPLSVLTANRMIHRFADGEEPVTEFKGNVLLTRTDMVLKTEKLLALGKDFHTIRADTGVDLREKKQNVHITAGLMIFEKNQDIVRLKKSPRMRFMKKDSDQVNATLSGAIIERRLKENKTIARGNVRIEQKTRAVTGELATYDEGAGVIVMDGEPALREKGGVVRCERILIFPDKNRVLLRNRISGYVAN